MHNAEGGLLFFRKLRAIKRKRT